MKRSWYPGDLYSYSYSEWGDLSKKIQVCSTWKNCKKSPKPFLSSSTATSYRISLELYFKMNERIRQNEPFISPLTLILKDELAI